MCTNDKLTVTDMKKIWSFEENEDGSLCITGYKGDDQDVIVPEFIGKNKVTAIAAYAFSPLKSHRSKEQGELLQRIYSVSIPNSIISIGEYAFCDCKRLSSVIMSNGILNVERGVFSGCENLSQINIPEGVITISERAFESCFALTSVNIPKSVTTIGDSAFFSCLTLSRIEIPNGVKSIGDFAFSVCVGLSDVILSNELTGIGEFAFADCEKLIVHAPSGSFAEQFARENNILFVAI